MEQGTLVRMEKHSNKYLRRFGGAAFLLAIAAGCQDQQALTLGSAEAGDARSITGRLLIPDSCQDMSNKQAMIRDMVKAVNAERAKLKLSPLHLNGTLSQIADFYACRMVDGGFFDHVDPVYGSTVDSRATDFGYAFIKIGENLAAGTENVEQSMSSWLNSSKHRENLIDPAYTEIGVSVKTGSPGGPYWVQEFGRPVTAGEESPAPLTPASVAAEVPTKPSVAPSAESPHK